MGNKNYKTMKKEYIKPEMDVIEVGINTILCMSEDVVNPNPPEPGTGGENPFGGREDYTRPGSGNVWDQGW